MNILIVNPIIYTSETKEIKRAATIKDTMIYDLCLAFKELGHNVTLVAGESYKPLTDEEYPFNVEWAQIRLQRLFPANSLPYCPEIKKIIKKNKFDLIISSEVFSLNSLMLAIRTPNNLIIWHELAKHNRIFKGIASKIWYGIIARIFFRKALVVARSVQARQFISQYCKKVSPTIIEHGVNLNKFTLCTEKKKQFAVSSQLIPRKRIDKILDAFSDFVKEYDSEYKLYIMGEGVEEEALRNQVDRLEINDNVIFTGKLEHKRLIEILKQSQALLVYTSKDNNMVSIVESIAVATPVITTSVPYNSSYIMENELGIVDDNWDKEALRQITSDNKYILNCIDYRSSLSTEEKVNAFLKAI